LSSSAPSMGSSPKCATAARAEPICLPTRAQKIQRFDPESAGVRAHPDAAAGTVVGHCYDKTLCPTQFRRDSRKYHG
jgi:hypothetical protein